VAELIATAATERPDAVALIDEFGETTWGALSERVNRLIAGLRELDIAPGDAVGIVSGNRRELFEITLACLHGSWRLVPINWHWTRDEIAYVLEDSSCTALLVDARFASDAVAAAQDCPHVRESIVVAGSGEAVDYEALLARSSPEEPRDQGLGVPMFYTSGTTGQPKGVRRNIDPIGADVAALQRAAGGFLSRRKLRPDGVTLLCGPAYHAAQWTHSVLLLIAGSTVVMRHRFDPAETLEVIDRYRVTNVHMVPTQFVRLLKLPAQQRQSFDGSSLERVEHGAAPCPPAIKRRMIEWWGPKLLEYYGGTEFGIVSMIESPEWLEHPGSVGRPEPNVEVVVLAEDGKPAAPGEPGQLFFRNSSGLDFSYHGDPDKTAAAHREGGLATLGDVGYLDEDGYVYLTDRKIDMIISGGVNIYPAEIEAVLIEHSAVADVAVFGIPDDEYGERVVAKVELADGIDPGPGLTEELVGMCRARLAGYKTPRVIEFERQLPRDDNGKLAKHALREPYWAGEAGRI
jgi:long-chain acyl-CoA synthetase